MHEPELEGIKNILQKKRGEGRKVTFKLLFEAKTSNELKEFHKKCDNMGPTLTLLYGCRNVLFGGYTSKDWVSTTSVSTAEDPEAFLFFKRLDSDADWQILAHKSFYWAITRHANFGPTFGGGYFYWSHYDLQTFVINSSDDSKEENGRLRLNGKLNINCAYKNPDRTFRNEDVNEGTLDVYRIAVYQVSEYYWRPKPFKAEIEKLKAYLCCVDSQRKQKLPFYNILLLGLVTAGKSSLIKTLATAISEKLKKTAQSGNYYTSVTNKFVSYRLLKSDGEDIHIKVFDTRGMHSQRDLSPELEHILNGALPEGYSFPDNPEEVPPEQLKTETSIQDRIHTVALVCDIAKCQVLETDNQAVLRSTVNLIRKKGIPLVVVATKCDTLDTDVHNDVNTIYGSKQIFDNMHTLSQITGVEVTDIFPVVNYGDDIEVSVAKNSLAIQALHSVVRLVEDYLEQSRECTNIWNSRFGTRPNRAEIENQKGYLCKSKSQRKHKLPFYNILLLGMISAGKSSLCNTFATAISGKSKNAAPTGQDAAGVTNKLHAYEILSSDGEDICIKVIDVRGIKAGRDVCPELEHILNGALPEGYSFSEDPVEVPFSQMKTDISTGDKIHIVALVCDVANWRWLEEDENEDLAALKSTITFIHKKDVRITRKSWRNFESLPEGRDELDIPDLDGRKFLVLCVGPARSGKSNFIDSLESALTGTITHKAEGEIYRTETGESSQTKKVQWYPLEKIRINNQQTDTPVLLGDMPGFQSRDGVTVDDVKMVIEGQTLPPPWIQAGPVGENEKVHCVSFVFDISTVGSMPESVKTSIRDIVQCVSKQNIPFIVVLTKNDVLSDAVYHRTKDLFHDRRVRVQMDKLQKMFGFREGIIFPVRNYTEERFVEADKNRLLLDAFQEILRLGSTHFLADQPDEPNRH